MKEYKDTENFKKLRARLINGIRDKGIKDNRVLKAIYTIPRQFFMPLDLEDMSYEDRPFPIGEGQTISQPYTVAYQTELLDVQPDDRVLEIGTGSGYQAAVLAILAREVFSIERQKKLFEKHREFNYLKQFDLYLFYGDGYEGLPDYAPFDKILITAAAPYIPPKLLEQLKWGGKMVLPLGEGKSQQMARIAKLDNGEIMEEYFHNFSFVPMLSGKKE
ncbi:MAG: protein-L-isoaspartate(D-aspartate) O-methyltransferase [Flavisolibacter sp.]